MAPVKEVAKTGRSRRETVHLTQKVLESLSPKEKPYIVNDDEIRGLVIKIYPTGARTFFLSVRTGRKGDMFKIGQWPDLNIAQAREKAKKMRGDLAQGKNPKDEKREGLTLKEFFEVYMERHGSNKKSSAKDRSQFERILKPWANYKLSEITR